jgi:Transposase domain (DUF772)
MSGPEVDADGDGTAGITPGEHVWVAAQALPCSPGHVFYEKPNALLEAGGFDRFVEELCAAHYAEDLGRPSIPPGVYFRMLFVGYFEGLDSQRAIAWRCADSLSLRSFLRIDLSKGTPDQKKQILEAIGSNLALTDKKLLFEARKHFRVLEDAVQKIPEIRGTFELRKNGATKGHAAHF